MELGLSPVCQNALPAMAEKLVEELKSLGIDITTR